MREGLSLEGGRFFVLEDQWSTKGAQEFPLGVVVIDGQKIKDALSESSVVYIGGSLGDEIIGFTTR